MLKKTIGAFCIMVFTLIIFESIFPLLLQIVPSIRDTELPRGFQILGQQSKQSALPQGEYIALLGDSYAYGAGDWRNSVAKRPYQPFNSAYVLHEMLDRDVVSFGIRGASGIEALTINPQQSLEALRTRFHIPQPAHLVYYFFEGNDLSDNVRFIRETPSLKHTLVEDAPTLQEREFHNRLRALATKDNFFSFTIKSHTLSAAFAVNLLQSFFANPISAEPSAVVYPAYMGNSTVTIQAYFGGPTSGLHPDNLEIGLSSLENALRLNRELFPGSTLTVVYIPASANIYAYAVTEVSVPDTNGAWVRSFAQGWERSDYVANRLEQITVAEGGYFLDTRSALRKAALSSMLHGPGDWNHFNQKGYTILGEEVALFLKSHVLKSE